MPWPHLHYSRLTASDASNAVPRHPSRTRWTRRACPRWNCALAWLSHGWCDKGRMLVSCRAGDLLASRIEVMWRYDGRTSGLHRETVLPNGRLQMMINLASGQGSICGFQSRHAVVDTASVPPVLGIVFRPGGACGLFG